MEGHLTLAVDLDPTGNLTGQFWLEYAKARSNPAAVYTGETLYPVCVPPHSWMVWM